MPRRRHILDGDATGGGHRHGTGRTGKTEFPHHWDDQKVIDYVLDVAARPDHVEWQKHRRWKTSGRRDGVEVQVIINPDGSVRSAYPLPGGRGVVQNPLRGGQGT